MLKGIAWLTGTAALVVSLAAAADAATTHQFTLTSQQAQVSTANGFPNVGGTAVTAGPSKAKGIGTGVELGKTTVTAHPTPTTYNLKGTGTDFYPNGSFKSTFTATITVNQDGSATFSVTGKYKGGTGKFKGASGKFTSTGKAAPNTTVATFQTKGTLKY
jgi:hypothetical protein